MQESFWLRIDKKSPDECWLWIGKLSNAGYGAHRKVYKSLHGAIPKGLVIMHLCNNRACCNPAHLKLGTYSENIKYAQACGRTDYKKVSLTCRVLKKGTGVQYDARSANYVIMFKVLGKPLYVGMNKNKELAQELAKAALDEVRKLMLANQHITYDEIRKHFHA